MENEKWTMKFVTPALIGIKTIEIIPKNKTNLTFSLFSLFSLFVSFGESVKIVRSFFGNGVIINAMI